MIRSFLLSRSNGDGNCRSLSRDGFPQPQIPCAGHQGHGGILSASRFRGKFDFDDCLVVRKKATHQDPNLSRSRRCNTCPVWISKSQFCMLFHRLACEYCNKGAMLQVIKTFLLCLMLLSSSLPSPPCMLCTVLIVSTNSQACLCVVCVMSVQMQQLPWRQP